MTSRSDTRETLRQLVRSHKHLLAAFRAQTEELGVLRRYILELRQEVKFIDPGWAADHYDEHGDWHSYSVRAKQ